MKKSSIVAVSMIVLYFVTAAMMCGAPPEPTHTYRGEPCDTEIDFFFALTRAEAESFISGGDVMVTFTKPAWLGFTKAGGDITVAASATTSEGLAVPLLADFHILMPVASQGLGSDTVYLKPEINRSALLDTASFLYKADPTKPIQVEIHYPLGDLQVSANDPAVFSPFTTTISVVANGTVTSQTTADLSLATLIEGYLLTTLDQVQDSAFSGQATQRRETLKNKVNAIANMFSARNVHGAREKMDNDLLVKFDGDDGGNAQDDWIVEPMARQNVYGPFWKMRKILMVLGG